jgi:hypothetical protein
LSQPDSWPNRHTLEHVLLDDNLLHGMVETPNYHLAKSKKNQISLNTIGAYYILHKNTCLSPGTSPTAVPSLRIQIISGAGLPFALHSTTAPVELEKSILFNGSLEKIGPFRSISFLFVTAAVTVRRIIFFKLIKNVGNQI